MKIRLLLLLTFLFTVGSWGQTTILNESFGTTASVFPTGWTSSNITNGFQAVTTSGSTGYSGASGSINARLNNTGSNGVVHTLTYANSLSTVGYTSITVLWGGRATGTFTQPVTFQWSSDGTVWNNVTYTQVTNNSTWALVNGGTRIALPVGAEGISSLRFRFSITSNNSGNYQIDDFTVQGTSSSPLLSASALTAFGSQCVGSTYGPNSFTITGSSLTTADVLVGALAGYTYSTTAGGSYTSSLTLTQGGGAYSQAIYVKFSPVSGISYSGNIPVSGGGATAINVAASATGTAAVTPGVSTAGSPSGAICAGTSVTFTATPSNLGGGTASYQWKLNGANVGTNSTTYTNAALVNNDVVGCVLTVAGGCVTTATATATNITMTVNPVPATPSAPTAAANPSCGATTLNAMTAPGGETYYWQGTTSNGTSVASNANVAYTVPSTGTYYVRSKNDTTGCWSAQSSIAMTINTVPTVPTNSNPAAVCEGSAVTITGAGGGATSYTFWNAASGGTQYVTGGGYTVTGAALITPTALAAGTYTYYVQGETATCVSATRKTITVTINAIPAVPVGTISGTTPSCGNTSLSFSGTAPGGVTYYWQSVSGGTSTANNAASNLTVSTSGNYYVRAKNSTANCWSASEVGPYAVSIVTGTIITAQPTNQSVIVGNTATFNVTATGATSYQWQVSTNGGSTWSNVGTNTNSYTTAATTLGMSTYQYQVLVSGTAPCPTVTSSAGILTVTTAPCLSENFAGGVLPSGWAQNQIIFTSNYADFSNVSGNGDLTTNAISNPTSLTFTLTRTSNTTPKDLVIEVSTTSQAAGFATVFTYDLNNTITGTTNCTVDLSAYSGNATVYVRFRKASATTSYWRIDDINVYCTSTSPTITLTPATLTGMTYSFGTGPSANQTFSASGTNLTADILLTPPTDYEISTAAGSGFGSTITLTQTAGTVNPTTIYVRLKSGLAVNTYNTENIVGTSAGAATKNVVCSGNVTIAAPANNLCGGATVLTVNAAAIAGNMSGSTVTAPFTVEKDVWYSFTPTCTGIHAITVAGFTGDIDIELFAGSCPATTTTLDESAGTTSTETISTSLTSGTTYYLRVLAYDTAAETSAFTAQVVSTSVLTLTNAGSPAAGNIPAGTANAVIMGFTTTPTCATSYDLTAVTLTKATLSTVTAADISGFRIFYDANSNGIVDGAEASISGAGIALATTMSFTLTGQTGITTARKYLLVANILAGAVNGNTIKVNLSPNTDLTSVLSPSGTKTGTALGNTQTITPPSCTSAVIASVTPTSGPVGTEVTITASSGNLTGATATFNGVAATVVSSSATQLVVTVPTGAATGNLIVTDGQPCNATTTFTVINNDITTCQGAGNSFTDLIISEVYDSLAGNVWHMELFNPTNAAINLDAVGANYRIERYGTIGDAAPTRTVDISGIIQPGAVWLADLGTISDPSCIKAFDFTSYAQGINEEDAIKLTKENVSVDIVHCPNEKGYTIKRITTASGPNPVFNAADWNTNSTEDCTDLGLFNATLNVPPTITAQPSINLTCSSTSAVVTVTATEGFAGGNALAYQWYVAAPGAATWTALTNTGVYTGTTASILNISSIAGLENYQYYCQVRENGAGCYKASVAVKIPASTSTTWNGTVWSNGTPTLGKLTIINGNYNTTTNGDIDACSLIVKTGFTATVTANHYFNIQNDLTVEAGGTLDVLDNGSLVQISDTGVNTGTIMMKRTANIRLYDYVYWSAPVVNFPVTSVSPSSPTGTIFKWNPTVANTNGGFGNWENTVENMVTAKGYIVRGPNGFNNTAPQALTANFTGVPHNGIYTPSIIRGNNQAADYLGTNGITITNKEDNWNLIGNPYPSAIKSLDFLGANNNIEGAVRLWTHGTLPNAGTPNPFYGSFAYNYTATDYIVHNGTATTSGPVGFNGLIAAGQSFLVLMNDGPAATQTVTFNNALRSKTYDNSQFYRNGDSQKSVGGVERHRIWLDLISPTNVINRAVVGYVDGATDQKDRMYDAYTDYKNAQNFYSLINDEVMIIQGKSLPFKVEDRVPMGIKVPSDGTYQIAIAAVDGLFSGGAQAIYLEDLLLNVIHNLSAAPYQFTTTQGIINNRFVLRYTDAALGNDSFEINQNSVIVATHNHEIRIKSQLEPMKNISVYDVLGRLVFEKNNVNDTEFTIQNLVVSQQALIVKIVLENGQTVSKKIVF